MSGQGRDPNEKRCFFCKKVSIETKNWMVVNLPHESVDANESLERINSSLLRNAGCFWIKRRSSERAWAPYMPSDGAKETLTFDTKHCRSDGRDIPSFLEEKK